MKKNVDDPEHESAHFFIPLFLNHPSALCSFAQGKVFLVYRTKKGEYATKNQSCFLSYLLLTHFVSAFHLISHHLKKNIRPVSSLLIHVLVQINTCISLCK